jgi:hypothetical protein
MTYDNWKTRSLLLGLATLMASVVTAAAGEGDFTCGKVNVSLRYNIDPDERLLTFTYPARQRHIRIPAIRYDTKTNKMMLNGKRCEEGE